MASPKQQHQTAKIDGQAQLLEANHLFDQGRLSEALDIAMLLHDQSDLHGAESLFRRGRTLLIETVGKRHPGTLSTCGHLALLLAQRGRHEQSYSLHKETLALKKCVLGATNHSTLITSFNLISLLMEMGRPARALQLCASELKLCRAHLRHGHQDTIDLAKLEKKIKQQLRTTPISGPSQTGSCRKRKQSSSAEPAASVLCSGALRQRQKKERTPVVKALPTVSFAQRTHLVRRPGFLSPDEAARLLATLESLPLQPYTNNHDDDFDKSGAAVHTTAYIQTNDLFAKEFPKLRKRLLQLAVETDLQEGWGQCTCPDTHTLLPTVSFRCVEFHCMAAGGKVGDQFHHDVGSVITIDLMLKEPTAGAAFQTTELGGEDDVQGLGWLKKHPFHVGDALVFLSHKYHSVSPLLAGTRRVLVSELWHGDRRVCGHRCDQHWGSCGFQDTAS